MTVNNELEIMWNK